jgi:hypothetical protein
MNVIGISHLILDNSFVPGGSYRLLYKESIECPPPKKSFLRAVPKSHVVSFWKGTDSPSIETVEYGNPSTGCSGPYQVNGEDILIQSFAIKDSLRFFSEGFEFQQTEELLIHRSLILGTNIKMKVIPADKSNQKTFLDDDGATCLALMVKDIKLSLSTAKKFGATEISEAFQMELGGKRFSIAFLRGPGGELVEVVQLLPNN